MAGEWLKMECDTPEKPEVMAITAALGWTDTDLTVGKLFRLWRWFDKHTIDGNAVGVTLALLDVQIGVTGFCEKLIAVNWLEVYDGGIRLPKFDRHNGTTAKSRSQTAKRVATFKANAKGNGQGNAVGNGASVTGALPREEKRREEDKSNPQPPAGGDSAAAEAASVARRRARTLVPYDDIVAAYRLQLPQLSQPATLSRKRKKAMDKAWALLPERHRLPAVFRAIFAECNEDPFLNGTGPYGGDHAGWEPNFDYLIREDVVAKVYEKAMHRRAARQAAGQSNPPMEQAA